MELEELVAVCGLYCGACPVYRVRQDNNQEGLEEIRQNMSQRQGREVSLDEVWCDGCLSGGRLSSFCQKCEIRLCAAGKPGVTRCSDCSDFPCDRIIAFNNDGVRHHAEVLDNVRRQQELGFEEWLQLEYERWRCEQCGVSLEWYSKSCPRCKTAQPYRLPSLPRDKK